MHGHVEVQETVSRQRRHVSDVLFHFPFGQKLDGYQLRQPRFAGCHKNVNG